MEKLLSNCNRDQFRNNYDTTLIALRGAGYAKDAKTLQTETFSASSTKRCLRALQANAVCKLSKLEHVV